MEINITALIGIIGGTIFAGGSVVAFFQMQTKQNMRIAALEKDMGEHKGKLSDQAGHQIKTEKLVIELQGKIDHLIEAVKDLKK